MAQSLPENPGGLIDCRWSAFQIERKERHADLVSELERLNRVPIKCKEEWLLALGLRHAVMLLNLRSRGRGQPGLDLPDGQFGIHVDTAIWTYGHRLRVKKPHPPHPLGGGDLRIVWIPNRHGVRLRVQTTQPRSEPFPGAPRLSKLGLCRQQSRLRERLGVAQVTSVFIGLVQCPDNRLDTPEQHPYERKESKEAERERHDLPAPAAKEPAQRLNPSKHDQSRERLESSLPSLTKDVAKIGRGSASLPGKRSRLVLSLGMGASSGFELCPNVVDVDGSRWAIKSGVEPRRGRRTIVASHGLRADNQDPSRVSAGLKAMLA